MLNIRSYNLGPLQTNAYLLTGADPQRGVIIDPGMNPAALLRAVKDMEIEAILLTHAHFDHIGGVDELRKAKNCPVYVHALESEWLVSPKLNGSLMWPEASPPIRTEPAEYDLAEGQILELLGLTFKVFHTPGHSPGSVSFLCGNDLFPEMSCLSLAWDVRICLEAVSVIWLIHCAASCTVWMKK